MKRPRERVWLIAGTAGWLFPVVALAAVLLSVVRSPATNWIVQLALGAFLLLALIRPAAALLVTTAFLGFGIILAHLAGVPSLRTVEVLVAASLAACCLRALAGDGPLRGALNEAISWPVVLLGAAAAASATVWLLVHQGGADSALTFAYQLQSFVTGEYFLQTGDFWMLAPAFVLLEGLGLYVAVGALCRLEPGFLSRALRMLTLGGIALALMSVVRLIEIMLRNPEVLEQLRATSVGLRLSPQIPDYIAAGSYFALCWVVALGCALASARRWMWWVLGSVPLLAGMYLTGSRSVIAAALAGLVVLTLVVASHRTRTRAVLAVSSIAVAAAITMIVGYSWWTGRDIAGEMARASLRVRVELIRTGLRVIETRPLFGVGLDRFYVAAGPLTSPELEALFPGRKNPHNDFLRFGAELGLVGLALFLWILGASGNRVWRAMRQTRDPRLAGLTGGLAAFLTTSMVSNPLMVRDVSYVFWIALGLAVAGSPRREQLDAHEGPGVAVGRSASAAGLRRAVPAVVLILLVASIPVRVRQELSSAHVGASDGLFDWGTDPDGRRRRWSGPQATIFVDGRARLVEIPLAGANLPSGRLQQVEIFVDGQLADRIVVSPQWRRFRMLLPSRPSPTPRRIDMLVSPVWVPADTIPGSADRRVHGVRVGEVTVVAEGAGR